MLVLLFQIVSDFRELGESGLEVFDDLGSDDVRVGKVGAVFERLVFQPEAVEVEFVALASGLCSFTSCVPIGCEISSLGGS